jgi:hypothetical protein
VGRWGERAACNKFGSWHNAAAVARGKGIQLVGELALLLITDDRRRLSVISDASGHKSGATRFYCRRKMSTRKGRAKRARVHPSIHPSTGSFACTDVGVYVHSLVSG